MSSGGRLPANTNPPGAKFWVGSHATRRCSAGREVAPLTSTLFPAPLYLAPSTYSLVPSPAKDRPWVAGGRLGSAKGTRTPPQNVRCGRLGRGGVPAGHTRELRLAVLSPPCQDVLSWMPPPPRRLPESPRRGCPAALPSPGDPHALLQDQRGGDEGAVQVAVARTPTRGRSPPTCTLTRIPMDFVVTGPPGR